MNMKKPHRLITFFALSLLLLGCENASHSTAVSGGDLTVTPVTYTYTVTLKDGKTAKAKKELFNYLQNNKKTLLVYGANITWTNKQTKALADSASKWLISSGTPIELVKVVQSPDTKQPGAISLSTRLYQVQTHLCKFRSISNYHSGDDGCYSDNLRWQAMLHPDRKLAGYSNITADNTQDQ